MTTYFPTLKRAPTKLKEQLIGELILCENKRRYTSKDDALKSLDRILIKGNYIYPILVGERDGKCYFISYFK